MLDGRYCELGRHHALQQDWETRGFADELDMFQSRSRFIGDTP